jgi:hypothetical protein
MYFGDILVTQNKLTGQTPPENDTIQTPNVYITHDFRILSDYTK